MAVVTDIEAAIERLLRAIDQAGVPDERRERRSTRRRSIAYRVIPAGWPGASANPSCWSMPS
jgi:hypothetical protein